MACNKGLPKVSQIGRLQLVRAEQEKYVYDIDQISTRLRREGLRVSKECQQRLRETLKEIEFDSF